MDTNDQIASARPDQQSSESILAAFEGRSAHEQPEAAKSTDAALDSAAQIRAQVLAPDPTIKSGLEIPEARPIPRSLPPSLQAELDAQTAANEQAAEAEVAAAEEWASEANLAFESLAVGLLNAALEDDFSVDGAADAVARTWIADQLDDDTVVALAGEGAQILLGMTDDDFTPGAVDDETLAENLAELGQATDEILLRANQLAKESLEVQQEQEFIAQMPELALKAREALVEHTKAFVASVGITSEVEAQARVNAAFEYAEKMLGVDCAAAASAGDWALFDSALRSADAAIAEDYVAGTRHAFKQAILDGPSSDVASGWEKPDPFGVMRPVNRQVLPNRGALPARIIERAGRQVETAKSIRQGLVAEQSTDVASGLTDGQGRPTSIPYVTGEYARQAREKERADAELIARVGGRLA